MKTNLWLLILVFGLVACGNKAPKDNNNEGKTGNNTNTTKNETNKPPTDPAPAETASMTSISEVDAWIGGTDANEGLKKEEYKAECGGGWGSMLKETSEKGLRKLTVDMSGEHGGVMVSYYYDDQNNLVAVKEIKGNYTLTDDMMEETRFYLKDGQVFGTNYRKTEGKSGKAPKLEEQAFEQVANGAQAFPQYEADLKKYQGLTAETFEEFICS